MDRPAVGMWPAHDLHVGGIWAAGWWHMHATGSERLFLRKVMRSEATRRRRAPPVIPGTLRAMD